MKLKTKCAIHKGALECQLAAMPHSTVCWFHMNNSVLFPRDREPVEERPDGSLQGHVELLRERQGNVCCICGYRFYGNQDVDVDHLHPWSAGGRNVLENFGLAHTKCNQRKSGLLLHDPRIRERLSKIDKHFVDSQGKQERALTPAEEKEACRRYKAGENTVELAKAFGVSDSTILNTIKRKGHKTRPAGRDRLPDKQEKEVCLRYKAGESTVELGEAFEVSSTCINRILKRNGYKPRTNKESRKLFYKNNRHPNRMSEEKEQEVCRRYAAGENGRELGEAFEVSSTCINRILKRNGYKSRTNKESHGGLTDKQEEEVCLRYKAGESPYELGKAFGVCDSTICNILRRHGVKIRPNKIANGGLTDEQEAEVCRRYLAEESQKKLGEAFEVSDVTIRNILKRKGVKIRSLSEAIKLHHANGS